MYVLWIFYDQRWTKHYLQLISARNEGLQDNFTLHTATADDVLKSMQTTVDVRN